MAKKLAIIPARIGSSRIKKKNVKNLAGRPIIYYSIKQAIESKLFDKIHISTDSEEISKISENMGVKVDFFRPKKLSTDKSILSDVINFTLDEFKRRGEEYKYFCMLWPTSPLREIKDIKHSFSLLKKKNGNAIVGVSNYDMSYFCGQSMDKNLFLKKIFEKKFWKSKNPDVICDCGSFVWNKVEAFKKFKSWLPPRTIGYQMPKYKSIDVDNEDDWELLEFYYQKYAKK